MCPSQRKKWTTSHPRHLTRWMFSRWQKQQKAAGRCLISIYPHCDRRSQPASPRGFAYVSGLARIRGRDWRKPHKHEEPPMSGFPDHPNARQNPHSESCVCHGGAEWRAAVSAVISDGRRGDARIVFVLAPPAPNVVELLCRSEMRQRNQVVLLQNRCVAVE